MILMSPASFTLMHVLLSVFGIAAGDRMERFLRNRARPQQRIFPAATILTRRPASFPRRECSRRPNTGISLVVLGSPCWRLLRQPDGRLALDL